MTTSSGLELASTVAPNEVGPVDILVVPGSPQLPTRPIDKALLSLVSTLSELGQLDGRRATTHWRHAAALARRYPKVRVEPDVIHVRDAQRYTSAGITAGIDLALALVEEDHGSAAAREIARELVMFMQRPGGQSQFSTALSGSPPVDSPLRSVTGTVLADPAADHSVNSMAREGAVSARHLTRLFHAEMQTTPARWLERVRVDRATQLLLDGHSVTVTAQRSGFGTDETLCRAFARNLGTTPTEYRQRFTTATPR